MSAVLTHFSASACGGYISYCVSQCEAAAPEGITSSCKLNRAHLSLSSLPLSAVCKQEPSCCNWVMWPSGRNCFPLLLLRRRKNNNNDDETSWSCCGRGRFGIKFPALHNLCWMLEEVIRRRQTYRRKGGEKRTGRRPEEAVKGKRIREEEGEESVEQEKGSRGD